MTFGKCAYVPIKEFNLHVARRGYTGEDGFEVRHVPSLLVPFSHIDELCLFSDLDPA
jgi:aminomethyltransferase